MSLRVPHKAYVRSQVVATLQGAIRNGEWKDRLPSERALSDLLGVSRMTVRKALADLEKQGVVGEGETNRARRILAGASSPVSSINAVEVAIVRDPKRRSMQNADLREHKLRLGLARLGIDSEVHFFSDRQFSSNRLSPRNWIGDRRRLWILSSPSLPMQKWFHENAADWTYVMGSADPQWNLPSIDINYRAVGRHAAGVLLAQGHRRLAILGLKDPASGDQETEAGFCEAVQVHSDADVRVFRHDGTKRGIYRQLDCIRNVIPAITGLLVYKGEAALTLFLRLLEQGIQLPRDLSVIARDPGSCFDLFPFEIAHYQIGDDAVIRHILGVVEQFMQNPASAFSSARLLSEFQKGDTVGMV